MTKIYDLNGAERDTTWLALAYDGAHVLPVPATTGPRWRIVAIYVTEGPALFKAELRGEEGTPVAQQPVAFSWPSLDNPSEDLPLLTMGAPILWTNRATHQWTDENGLTGFGLGGAYGPLYQAFVMSSLPSDCMVGAGMKGSTNHRGPLHVVWQIVTPAPTYETLIEALRVAAQTAQVIQFNPQAALQKRIFADGFVPNSSEFNVTFEGVTYRGQRAEHLQTGAVRAYYCRVDDWSNVRYVGW